MDFTLQNRKQNIDIYIPKICLHSPALIKRDGNLVWIHQTTIKTVKLKSARAAMECHNSQFSSLLMQWCTRPPYSQWRHPPTLGAFRIGTRARKREKICAHFQRCLIYYTFRNRLRPSNFSSKGNKVFDLKMRWKKYICRYFTHKILHLILRVFKKLKVFWQVFDWLWTWVRINVLWF